MVAKEKVSIDEVSEDYGYCEVSGTSKREREEREGTVLIRLTVLSESASAGRAPSDLFEARRTQQDPVLRTGST